MSLVEEQEDEDNTDADKLTIKKKRIEYMTSAF